MDDIDSWIEVRLEAALKAAATDRHVFPEAVPKELQRLLAGQLQEARKPSELDAIAAALISANRGAQ
jgi:hypothetical protein